MMKQENKFRPVVKWLCYTGFLLLAYVLQTMPGLFTFFSAKPVWLVAVAVCVAMYEDVLSSAVFCAVAGLLWDISADRLFGFNGLILLVCGVLISLLCIYYLHTRLVNSVWFCAAAMAIQGLLDYVFCFVIWRYDGASAVIWQQILPCLLFTVAVTPLVFLVVKRAAFAFHHAPRA